MFLHRRDLLSGWSVIISGRYGHCNGIEVYAIIVMGSRSGTIALLPGNTYTIYKLSHAFYRENETVP